MEFRRYNDREAASGEIYSNHDTNDSSNELRLLHTSKRRKDRNPLLTSHPGFWAHRQRCPYFPIIMSHRSIKKPE